MQSASYSKGRNKDQSFQSVLGFSCWLFFQDNVHTPFLQSFTNSAGFSSLASSFCLLLICHHFNTSGCIKNLHIIKNTVIATHGTHTILSRLSETSNQEKISIRFRSQAMSVQAEWWANITSKFVSYKCNGVRKPFLFSKHNATINCVK